jgi:hypothetical protein
MGKYEWEIRASITKSMPAHHQIIRIQVYDVLVLSIKDYGTSCHTRSPSLGSSK